MVHLYFIWIIIFNGDDSYDGGCIFHYIILDFNWIKTFYDYWMGKQWGIFRPSFIYPMDKKFKNVQKKGIISRLEIG